MRLVLSPAMQSDLLNSDNSKATTIQAVESRCVGAESSENGELQINHAAIVQEVHRLPSIPEEPSAILCSSQPHADPNQKIQSQPRRKDEKDQLSQLLPALNGGLMELLHYIEREVSDASQTNPLVVDITNEQEAIALMGF